MSFMVESVTVGNVPGSPVVVTGCGDASLSDVLCPHGIAADALHVGCHCRLADGVFCCCVVHEERAVVLFDHGSIIGTGGDGSPPLVDSCSSELFEGVPVHEVMNHLVVLDIPGEVFLKDAVGVSAAKLVDDGVESALGGDALPSTVKDLHEVVTDLGDQVAMQANLRDAVFGADLGVLQSPVLVCLDGGVHE